MKMGAKFFLSVSIQSAVVAAFSFFCAFIRVLLLFIYTESEPGSSVSIVSCYGLDDWAVEIRAPSEAKGFLL
jgi:hypothetical protein